jgi:hypothetical protein
VDTVTLVENRIDDGRKLVEMLALKGVDVSGAAWVLTGDAGVWYFYIVTEVVDKKGLTAAYRDVYDVHRSMSGVCISATEIKLVGKSSPIGRDILEIRGESAATSPIHYRGSLLGNLAVEEAYVYPAYAPLRLSYMVTYTRHGEANRWEAHAEQGRLFRGIDASGAVSHSTFRWGDQQAGTERLATVSVLLDVGPQFDDRKSLNDPNVRQVMKRQAMIVGDEMFRAYHPDAVIEHVNDDEEL